MFVAFIMGLPSLTQLAPQERLVSMLREGQGIIYNEAETVNSTIESVELTQCPVCSRLLGSGLNRLCTGWALPTATAAELDLEATQD
jgi:hypothetical protein